MGSTFFGLTPDQKFNIYTQIHEIVFHGKGGYTWNDVYNMPLWLRRFTFNKMKEYYDSENQETQKAYNNMKKKTTAKPNIKPNYTTRASNK